MLYFSRRIKFSSSAYAPVPPEMDTLYPANARIWHFIAFQHRNMKAYLQKSVQHLWRIFYFKLLPRESTFPDQVTGHLHTQFNQWCFWLNKFGIFLSPYIHRLASHFPHSLPNVPVCRFSVDHYHKFPRLSKHSISRNLSRPGKRYLRLRNPAIIYNLPL